MAIITEQDPPNQPSSQLRKRTSSTSTSNKPSSSTTLQPTTSTPTKPKPENPFQFWFYFTLLVSLVTLIFIFLSSLSPQDPKTWFLNLPPNLRRHYSNGRTIKVQTSPNHPQIELFSLQQGPTSSDSHVLIIHGLGCSSFSFQNVLKFLGAKNVHAVAIDLPGSGFSDKSITVVEDHVLGESGFLDRLWGVYEEIKEKGLFWGFDQLVEQGYVDFEQTRSSNVRVVKKEIVKAIEIGSEEMGKVLGQVVDSMGLTPVDLVLHDSSLLLSANWISENRGLIRSVIVLDSGNALPIWALEMPIVKAFVLGFRFVFERVITMCCMKSVVDDEAEAHMILLNGRDGGRGVVGMGKKINSSFDLSEWSRLDGVKDLPVKVIWSNEWSDEWTAKGVEISGAIPQATLVTHSGGRWTQDENADEVASSIYEFISSLPKVTKQAVDEPIPQHFHEMFDESKSSDHHHNHHDHGGYMDAYGLGHGLAM